MGPQFYIGLIVGVVGTYLGMVLAAVLVLRGYNPFPA